MGNKRIVNIVGARPNLIKIAPLLWQMKKVVDLEPILVHTGQHYDPELSDIFFRQLDIPPPGYYLGVGSGSHSAQTAQIMIRLEELLKNLKPDIVLVVGDVNSTIAAALVAAKLQIPLTHVEAGLRSFDRTMPEEINRVVTDSLAQLLFVTEESGIENLRREGVQTFLNNGDPIDEMSGAILRELKYLCNSTLSNRIAAFVGNVMIDTLMNLRERVEKEAKIDLPDREYALLTLHRPSNVDNQETFNGILSTLAQLAREIPILFPCHPRTRERIREFGFGSFFKAIDKSSTIFSLNSCIALLEPLGYFEFLKLMAHAKLVLTDSGGIQEETTILGIPCFTLRENTERPVTIKQGTSTLVGDDPGVILKEVKTALNGQIKKGSRPTLWDGRASKRIVRILEGYSI